MIFLMILSDDNTTPYSKCDQAFDLRYPSQLQDTGMCKKTGC